MKSNLQNRINQARHFTIIGPCPFSVNKLKRELLKLSDQSAIVLIYVDGGLRYRSHIAKIFPDQLPFSFSIGDNDSSIEVLDVLKKDQEISDLCFLLEWMAVLKPRILTMSLWGFLGTTSRYDHLLSNLGELYRFSISPNAKNVLINMEHKVYFLQEGKHLFSNKMSFSLMAIDPVKITIKGECVYPFKGVLKPLSSRGLSNQGLGEFEISTSGPIIYFQNKI